MAVTVTQTNNQLIKFRKQVWREWRRGNLFSPYMGEGPTSIIQTIFEPRDGGDIVNCPLVGALRGPGVSTGPLTGNEEKLDNYGMRVWVDWIRNAVLLTKAQQRKSSFEQLEIVRPVLNEWQKCLQRDEIVLAFNALPSESPPANWGSESTAGQRVNGIIYDLASTAQKNTWHTHNSDRIVYGVELGNYVSADHAASLANIANTEKASANQLMLMKRVARRANPGITPYRQSETKGREYFVAFCGQEPFRDYSNDPLIYNANKDARAREGNGMDDNPIFQDGDLLYRGVIIREVPEIDDFCRLATAGGGSGPVSPVFFCGQNAICLPWGEMPKPTERTEDDYGMLIGRGIEAVYGVGKTFKRQPGDTEGTAGKLVQWGVVTGYVASPADA